jgi:drug/metabolite transporter (DMT)-like permease
MPIVFALLTAFANALNVVTQHKASINAPERSKGWRFVVYLFRNPLWLFGWVALAGAFVFQALALHNGPISVVQSLLVTELVFALLLRWLWVHQVIRAVTWWSAGVTCVALAVFLTVGEPSGGSAQPTSTAWVSAGLATVGGVALLALLGWRWQGSAGRRAALLGASASMLWAFVATLIKATMDTLTEFGVAGMFTHWPVYALAVAGLTAEVLNQAALHVGPLSVSQPFIVIVDPIVSIALSVWIYQESFSPDALRLGLGAAAFATMCGAVVVLTRTAPSTMDAEPRATAGA